MIPAASEPWRLTASLDALRNAAPEGPSFSYAPPPRPGAPIRKNARGDGADAAPFQYR